MSTRVPKVRLKPDQSWLILLMIIGGALANRPPRFLIDGQSEIVVRLKEGLDTPVGKSEPPNFQKRKELYPRAYTIYHDMLNSKATM